MSVSNSAELEDFADELDDFLELDDDSTLLLDSTGFTELEEFSTFTELDDS